MQSPAANQSVGGACCGRGGHLGGSFTVANFHSDGARARGGRATGLRGVAGQ